MNNEDTESVDLYVAFVANQRLAIGYLSDISTQLRLSLIHI